MNHSECSKAGCCVWTTTGDIDIRVCCSPNCDMGIPETDIARLRACHVDLKNYSAGSDVCHCKAHVLDLCDACFARSADHDDRSRIIPVAKGAANTCFI